MSENIRKGRKYRVLTDAINNAWTRYSFWTHSDDVEMPDGNSASTNLGGIKGITTSTSVTTTGIAADASTVTNINDRMGGLKFQFNEDTGLAEWAKEGDTGADAWRPFSSKPKTLIDDTGSELRPSNDGTIDVKPFCIANGIDYSKLSADNFQMETVDTVLGVWWSGTTTIPDSAKNAFGNEAANEPSIEYDSSTGILKFKAGRKLKNAGAVVWFDESSNDVGSLAYMDHGIWAADSYTRINNSVYPKYNPSGSRKHIRVNIGSTIYTWMYVLPQVKINYVANPYT